MMRDIKRYDKEFLVKLYTGMLRIRRFEEKSAQLYGQRKIGGFCHLYNGQEAVAVGAAAALDLSKDYLLTGYRDHGYALASGMSPESVMAELLGKATGCSKGKGGSMHMFDAKRHMLGGNGIVGAQIPIATGAAFAQSYRKDGGVTLCFFGDGAIHQGAFHESLNLAKIWKLPVVYICENNQFGMGTNFKRVSSVDDFTVMGASYGIPGKQIDGMDVIAVYEEISEYVSAARGGLPGFIEAKTYRYKGHSMSDPQKYRTREELEEYKKQDPIELLKAGMLEERMLAQEDFESIEKQAAESVASATAFAEESEEPALHTLYEDVFA